MARTAVRKNERLRDLAHAYAEAQLTPEEKAAARAEVEADVARAACEGVYRRMLELEGKVKWSKWWWQLRFEE